MFGVGFTFNSWPRRFVCSGLLSLRGMSFFVLTRVFYDYRYWLLLTATLFDRSNSELVNKLVTGGEKLRIIRLMLLKNRSIRLTIQYQKQNSFSIDVSKIKYKMEWINTNFQHIIIMVRSKDLGVEEIEQRIKI